jgi:SNF2 family DNA or RNA helicase
VRLTASLHGNVLTVLQEGGFTPEARIILKSVARGARCQDGVHWTYPYTKGALTLLKEGAEFLDADLQLDPELEKALGELQAETERELALRQFMQRYIDDRTLTLPEYTTLNAPPPWWHQKVAYHWAQRVQSIYLAHKPGLGKTRTGIDIIRGRIDAGWVRWPHHVYVQEHESQAVPGKTIPGHWAIEGSVLIVCPKVVIGTWVEELRRFQGIEPVVITGSSAAKKYQRAGTQSWVQICTYDSLHMVEDNRYDGIIADEFHYCANEDSIRFARMQHLRDHCRWFVGMSGTPVSNMLPSLWAQYYILDGGRTLGASYESYMDRYFENARTKEAKEGAAEAVSHRIARITYFENMTHAFPERDVRKIHQMRQVEMTTEQQRYYCRVRDQAVADVLAGYVSTENTAVKLLRLLQICQGWVKDDNGELQIFTSAKLRALEADVTGQGDLTDRRLIIWCRFKYDMVQVARMLNKHQVQYMALHGDIKQDDRERIRDIWNSDHRYTVLIGMIQMGIGINLHAPNCVDFNGAPARCSTTCFYGFDWPVTQLEQAMDRVYRGDQVETCLYRYYVNEDIGTIQPMDARVYSTLQAKLGQAKELEEGSVGYVRHLLGVD